MSGTKFTPGPWECEIVGDKCKHLCPAKYGVSILTVALEYKDDEDEPTYFGAVYKPEDACLIAAAPDMYEALKEIVRYITPRGARTISEAIESLKWFERVKAQVSAAIAKAEGES